MTVIVDSRKTGIPGGSNISTRYKFFIPGSQFVGSGNAKDLSGNNADATIDSGTTDAAVWANKGYITTAVGVNKGLYVAAAKATFNLSTQSVIFAFVVNETAAATTDFIAGNGNSTFDGLIVYLSAANKLGIQITTPGPVVTTPAVSTATVKDGTDHAVMIAIDGVTKSAYYYIDGILSDALANAVVGSTTPTQNFGIGFVTSQAAIAAKFNGVHLLAMNGGLPSNINLLAAKHAAAPRQWFTDGDFL